MDIVQTVKKGCNLVAWRFYTPLNRLLFRLNHVSYGKNLKVRGTVYIYRHYPSAVIRLGDGVSINSAGWANPIGSGDRTYFQVNRDAKLIIGNNCGISNTAFTCEKEIVVEDDVMIGSGCRIYDTDFHPSDFQKRMAADQTAIARAKVVIGQGSFIGAGCYILKGVQIGRYCVVGAGSVVTKNIPDGETWAGNPARKIR